MSYLSIHTPAKYASEVSARVSGHVSVDFSVSKEREARLLDTPADTEWFAVWKNSSVAFYFGYARSTDRYYLPSVGKYADFGVVLNVSPSSDRVVMTDEELFALTATSSYPDIFFRIRSGLMTGPVLYPADVLVSFKRPYASRGFEIPGGGNAIASSGFHGAMDDLSSAGVVLTEKEGIPSMVRSDTFLSLFDELQKHLERKGIEQRVTDSTFLLEY